MMSTKTNKQAPLRPRVVYERPGEAPRDPRLVWGGVALIGLCLIVLSFWAGGWSLSAQYDALQAERDELLQIQLEQAQALSQERRVRIQAEQGRQVDQKAAEVLRQQILTLENERAELEKNLAFYQRVLAPELGGKGLQVSQLELLPAVEDNWFYYRLVLTQNSKRAKAVKGALAVFVGGVQDGVSKEWPLSELSPALESNTQNFNFRYFQVVPTSNQLGLIRLPEGVTPLFVRVELMPQGKSEPLVRKFTWTTEGTL